MAAETMALQLAEIEHRAINAFHAIAALAAREAADNPAGRLGLGRVRCQALASAQLFGLLSSRNQGDGICAKEFLETVMGHVAEGLLEPVGATAEVYCERGTADYRRLQAMGMIVCELAANAAKHAFAGGRGGALRVTLLSDEITESLILSVCDDGPGIDCLVTAADRGLGLVGRIVQSMGGESSISSGPDGTAFSFRFSPSA